MWFDATTSKIHAKFPPRRTLDNFSSKCQNFRKKISKFSKSEKTQIKHRKRHLLTKFEPTSILQKFQK
jgi:hypothetical protein